MWTRTRAAEILGIALPIVQGPFGGGNSTVALAAAVSEAGALGSFGAVDLPPAELGPLVEQLRQRTNKPFSLNLWVPIPAQERSDEDASVSEADWQRSLERVGPFLRELGLPLPVRPAAYRQPFDAQVEALLQARPPVFSFVMGVPDKTVLDEARKRGIRTVGTATTVDEAVAIEAAGADLVVASGSDAGGHRGSFLRSAEDSLVGTMSLVPQMASAVGIPVIAAGGIADGRGIAAALALGAEGVQIGTAFLSSPEAGAPEAHKRLLGQERSRWTRLTRAFTGRHARGLPNELMDALQDPLLPYPMQHWLTLPLRKAAGKAGLSERLALWAGQNAASARGLPAAALVSALVEETDQVLRSTRLHPRIAP